MRTNVIYIFAVLTTVIMPWSALAESQEIVTLTLNNDSSYIGSIVKQSYSGDSIWFSYNYDKDKYTKDLGDNYACKSFASADIKSIDYSKRNENSNVGVVDEIDLGNERIISGQIVLRNGNSYTIYAEDEEKTVDIDEKATTRIKPLNPHLPIEKQVSHLDYITLLDATKGSSATELEGIIIEKGCDYLILRTQNNGDKRIRYDEIDFVERKTNPQYIEDIVSPIDNNHLKVGGILSQWCDFEMKKKCMELSNDMKFVKAKLIEGDKLRVELGYKITTEHILLYPCDDVELKKKKIDYISFLKKMIMLSSEQKTIKFNNWRIEFAIERDNSDYLLFDLENNKVFGISIYE